MTDEEPKPQPETIQPASTTLGYPVRFRIADMANAPTIVLAGHRQPQKMSLFFSWFVLQHFTHKFVEALAAVPHDPEGIFIIHFGALKLRPEEAIYFEEKGNSGLVTPAGIPAPKVS